MNEILYIYTVFVRFFFLCVCVCGGDYVCVNRGRRDRHFPKEQICILGLLYGGGVACLHYYVEIIIPAYKYKQENYENLKKKVMGNLKQADNNLQLLIPVIKALLYEKAFFENLA